MKKIVLMLFLFTGVKIAVSQIAGNQVFSNNSRYYADEKSVARHNQLNKLYVSDSGFIIEAKILKNVKADSYVAVFALSQEAKTVQSCNIQINERIKRFINNLLKIGIKETDIYTDLISQYKVYDFNKINSTYEEYLKGFELSKNIIVKYTSAGQIEQLLTIASQDSIFDLIKVDYIINDISNVYDDLFAIAKEVIQKKKQLYLNLTEAKLKSGAQIYAENFSSYYPTELYKSYKAFAQNRYSNNYWRNEKETKELHKFETFYYDPISYSGFDKIINPVVIEPMVQVALTIQVKYEILK